MVKDRIGDLKAAQGRNADDYDAEDVAVNIEIESEIDPFLREVEDIRNEIHKIEANITELKQKHSKILESPTTDEKIKAEVEDLMAEIKIAANKVRLRLKEIEKNIEILGDEEISLIKLRITKTHHCALTKQFVAAMTANNNTQCYYRDKCKERIKRQLEICGKDTTDEELECLIEKGNLAVFTEGIIFETNLARRTLADIEVRHSEILTLEKSILELQHLFMDMVTIIEGQREMIDSIETHCFEAVQYVGQATADMKIAKKFKKDAIKKKIKIFSFFFIIGLCASIFGAYYLSLL